MKVKLMCASDMIEDITYLCLSTKMNILGCIFDKKTHFGITLVRRRKCKSGVFKTTRQ